MSRVYKHALCEKLRAGDKCIQPAIHDKIGNKGIGIKNNRCLRRYQFFTGSI